MLSRIAVVSCQFGRLLISSRHSAQFSFVSKSRNLGSFSSNIQEQKSQIWLVTYANNKLTTEKLVPPVSNCPPSILRLGIPPSVVVSKNNLNFPEINIFSHHVASITRPLDHQIGSKIPVQKLGLQCLSLHLHLHLHFTFLVVNARLSINPQGADFV